MDYAKVKSLLERKAQYLDHEQEKLSILLVELGDQFARGLRSVLKGTFDRDALVALSTEMGWIEAMGDFMDEGIEKLLGYSQLLTKAMGIPFLITEENEAILSEYLLNVSLNTRTTFGEAVGRDMVQFAFENKFAGNSIDLVVAEASDKLRATGRRAATEVGTSLTIFDRTQMSLAYENADIERFTYFPPTTIETTRDSCRRAINDERQKTGWTRAEIEADPELDFIKGGKPYFNCRHEWIPFIPEGSAGNAA